MQEAGRAGRDRKLALSYILFNDQEVELPTEDELIDHDLDINMYFHKNSFKGIAKELAVLYELLTEIYFPDRTFELENLINNEFDINVKCNYFEGGAAKNLYFELGYNEPLGYFSLNTLSGFTNYTKNNGTVVNSKMPDISNRIWPLLKNYIENLNLDEPVHIWLQKSDKQIGIEKLLESKKEGDTFNLTVGFYNNITERIEIIGSILRDFLHPNFSNQLIKQLRSSSLSSNDFIEKLGEKYLIYTGEELDFEKKCLERDKLLHRQTGETSKKFHHYYNGYRDKMDTEKAIYRLSTLGIIDDYTVNFSSNTFTLKGCKKAAKEYRANLNAYLLKYYSEKTTKAKLRNIDKIDESTPMRKALYFLVDFVYSEIQKKRQLAIHDMNTACRLGLEKGSVELKDYIDLYFNSKYARAGYSYFNEKGKEVNASLPDHTDNGKNEDLNLVWLFMEIVDEDPKSNQIDNTKHLRGACTRMLNNQPDSYTLLLLNAFTLYMLEYKNSRYLQEAENLLINAFTSIQDKESNWNDKKLEEVYTVYTDKLIDRNGELEKYMELHGFSFDFDSIMIKRFLNPLQKANSTLRNLNKILNNYDKPNSTAD